MTHYQCNRCLFEFYIHEEKGVRFCPKCGQESAIIPPLEVIFEIYNLEIDERERRISCSYGQVMTKDIFRDRKISKAELKVFYD
jgi:hypothetical protein